MKISMIQLKIEEGIKTNVSHVQNMLHPKLDTDIIVLPEMWTSPYQNDRFKDHSVTIGDETYQVMQEIARHQKAYLVAGSVPERHQDNLYNTTFVFDPKGNQIATYRKIHLFEITYPDKTVYRERDIIEKGNEIVTFDTPFGRFGLMICFDIRFPLLSKKLQEQGAKALIVPAAFNQYTGPKHWSLAFRSRAVDNQLFTIGVSPSEDSTGTYQYYGHSIVVNPLGEVVYEMGTKEEIKTIEIDIEDVEKIRKAFPILLNEIVL